MVKLVGLLCVILLAVFAYTYYPSNNVATNNGVFGRSVYNTNSVPGSSADPNYVMSFPSDHQAHPNFDIEWWYFTANLQDKNGNEYGLQWTLFRFKDPTAVSEQTSSSWGNDQLFMAHASLHSNDKHWFSEKLARAGVGNASVSAYPFTLAIDDWYWTNTLPDNNLLPAKLVFSAGTKFQSQANKFENIDVSLELSANGPIVKQGINGYSIKTKEAAHASHYYSAPFINVEGSFKTSNENINVTGKGWFDHEWTSGLLDDQTLGWDWFSLHLDNGDKLMAFRMRMRDGQDYVTASYIDAGGSSTTFSYPDITLLPTAMFPVYTQEGERPMPLEWRLSLPNKNLDLLVVTTKQQQWNPALVPYYEGQIHITGTHTGKGFMELTGY